MKVLFIHNTVADYRRDLLLDIQNRGSYEFLITHESLAKSVYSYQGTERQESATWRLVKEDRWHWFRLVNELLRTDAEVVVIPPPDRTGEFIESLTSLLVTKLRKKKAVLFWERWEAPSARCPRILAATNASKRVVLRWAFRLLDQVLVPGLRSRDYFLTLKVPSHKISIVGNVSASISSLPVEVRRADLGIGDDALVVLFLGRVIRRKGLHLLLDAWVGVQESVPSAVLVVAGGGPEEESCRNLALRNRLQNVHFLGEIPFSRRASFFRLCDLFVLPSLFHGGVTEAWGLTVNEALELGVPAVVTTAVGCAPDLVETTDTGIVVEENDGHALATAIVNILDDSDKRKMMSEQAATLINTKFTAEVVGEQFHRAVQSVGRA